MAGGNAAKRFVIKLCSINGIFTRHVVFVLCAFCVLSQQDSKGTCGYHIGSTV